MQNHEQTKFWFSSIVGFYYQCGISCDVDKNKALELYLLTINLNIKNDLEDYIQNKKEIETDDQKDFETYLKLAKENDPKAQYNLGNCYRFGRGVNQDYNKAFEWYSKSANNGYAEGQCSLGFFYKNGFGTDKNEKKAFESYLKSAALGNA